MIWTEFYLAEPRSLAEIADAVRATFCLSAEEVLVIPEDNIVETDVPPSVRALVETNRIKGEFPMSIAVFLRDPSLTPADSLQTIGQICERLNADALVSDDSPNPYSWVLVHGRANRQRVILNAKRLDDSDELVVGHILEEG